MDAVGAGDTPFYSVLFRASLPRDIHTPRLMARLSWSRYSVVVDAPGRFIWRLLCPAIPQSSLTTTRSPAPRDSRRAIQPLDGGAFARYGGGSAAPDALIISLSQLQDIRLVNSATGAGDSMLQAFWQRLVLVTDTALYLRFLLAVR